MPLISYILPSLNEAKHIGKALESIAKQKGSKEAIVCDGGSIDQTLSIARAFDFCRIIPSEPGRGVQMNLGASFAKGNFLCFLHADTSLPDGASSSIKQVLSRPQVIAGSFRLKFDSRNRLLAFFAACSQINSPLFTYGDQGLFLRKKTFEFLGGFKNYPFLEDVEMQRRLRVYGAFEKSPLSVTTSARRFERGGIIRQQLLNTFIVSAFLCGASPFALKRLYPDNK